MSLRVDTSSLITGALVCGNRGLGVLGSVVPGGGDDGAGYLYNDLTLPDDAYKEVRGLIIAQPSYGTLYAYEDSSFSFTGAPDGTYSFTYRLFVDGVDGGTATSYLQVGVADFNLSITTDSAVFSGNGESGFVATITASTADAIVSASAVTANISDAAFVATTDDLLSSIFMTAIPVTLTSADLSAIAAAVLAAAQVEPIHADIRKVNNYAVTGEGTEANPWNPA